MNIDYDEISQSGNSQKDYNKIHIIKECSKQFNKEKQNLNQEKETNDETVQKSIEDNFKLKLDDDIYDNDDSVLQEGNNSITEQSLKYFESKSSELEDKNIEEKKDKNFLGKKIERNNEEKKDDNKKDDDKDKKDNDQKKEEPQPSNPEVTKRIDSKIINELKHLELLDKWFEHKLNYKLLYRATEEQYSASIFHQKVDSYKNTIIFIKDINNFIYGGFTTKTWDGNKSYKSDKNAILFNLDKEKYYDVNDYSHAILCDKDLLAVFGDGDLILGPKSIESAFPKSFGNKDVKDNELTMGYNKLSPVEMEVFQLSY